MNFFSDKPSGAWTLFLDRDGVINRRIPGGYVRSLEEFELLPGALDALVFFASFFARIFIVSNQQGVGKGVMTSADVDRIHAHLKEQVLLRGGRVDGIYYCPALATEKAICRKPSPGMALQAKRTYPEVDFRRSVMAGDSLSDLIFARDLGMVPLFIETEPLRDQDCSGFYALKFPSLSALATYIQQR
ncbi:MAG: phosphatase [Bacteroidetes bacterium]|nr:MAG: phosphatase [Bacteroidota bacterium]